MARPTDDPKTFRLDLRFPPDMVEEVDEWRRKQRDIPARAEAIRRLVDLGLQYDAAHAHIRALTDQVIEWAKRSGASEDELANVGRNLGFMSALLRPTFLTNDDLYKPLDDFLKEHSVSPDINRPVQPTPKKPKKG